MYFFDTSVRCSWADQFPLHPAEATEAFRENSILLNTSSLNFLPFHTPRNSLLGETTPFPPSFSPPLCWFYLNAPNPLLTSLSFFFLFRENPLPLLSPTKTKPASCAQVATKASVSEPPPPPPSHLVRVRVGGLVRKNVKWLSGTCRLDTNNCWPPHRHRRRFWLNVGDATRAETTGGKGVGRGWGGDVCCYCFVVFLCFRAVGKGAGLEVERRGRYLHGFAGQWCRSGLFECGFKV